MMMRAKHWRTAGIVFLAMTSAAWPQASTRPAGDKKAEGFLSLAELQKFYEDKIEQSRRDIEAERLAALEKFLKTAPAAEKQQTLEDMMESAMFLDRYDQVIALSDQYLKDAPNNPETWPARHMRIVALLSTKRIDQARAEWDKVSTKLDVQVWQQAWQQVFDAGIMIADALIEAGRINDVSAFYKTIKEHFSFVQNLSQVMGPREDALRWLGKTPPAIEGQDLSGQKVDLAQYKGKVVLIDFWATWCQPCVMALPDLLETYKTYHSAGFEVIGISLDQDKDALTKFLKARSIPWPIIFDGKAWYSPSARKFEVTAIPATFLIDREGKIAMVGTPSRGFGPMLKRLLEQPAEKKK
jgi:peroxiredoxin